MPKVGIATTTLDYGRCPSWLFDRMKRLSRAITIAIVEEYGSEEFLRRLSDPVWFQSFGCVLGFDWNSSGLGVTTLGALKAGLFDFQDELGIYICGGKRSSRKTPEEIKNFCLSSNLSFFDDLVYASKMAAKVDSSLIQDGYQIYQHNFLFTKSGSWAVIQQGMNIQNQTARRYHWLSDNLLSDNGIKNFVEEPHSGIISESKIENTLDLSSKESRENRKISLQLCKDPKTFLQDFKLIFEKRDRLLVNTRYSGFTELRLNDTEFYWHPVLEEKFDIKRLEKTIFACNFENPDTFEKLLAIRGVGPKTIRALSLVAEIIYGAKPSYQDPARYSWAHGGKDGTPIAVELNTLDFTISMLEKSINRAKVSIQDKIFLQRRLISLYE